MPTLILSPLATSLEVLPPSLVGGQGIETTYELIHNALSTIIASVPFYVLETQANGNVRVGPETSQPTVYYNEIASAFGPSRNRTSLMREPIVRQWQILLEFATRVTIEPLELALCLRVPTIPGIASIKSSPLFVQIVKSEVEHPREEQSPQGTFARVLVEVSSARSANPV